MTSYQNHFVSSIQEFRIWAFLNLALSPVGFKPMTFCHGLPHEPPSLTSEQFTFLLFH